MTNRTAAESIILNFAKEVDPSGSTLQIYKTLFKEWGDDRFNEFMIDVEQYGYIPIYVTVMYQEKLTVDEILDLAKKLGVNIMQHLVVKDDNDGNEYTTPRKYMILELPVRRQSQTLEEKIATYRDFNTIDSLTGQTVGDSKGAGFSQPEINMTLANNQKDKLYELLKFRGGDLIAQRDMLSSIMQDGVYYLGTYDKDTVTTGTKHMEALLKGAHLSANFSK